MLEKAIAKIATLPDAASYDLGWRPQLYTIMAGNAREAVLRPAGLETVVGLFTAFTASGPRFGACATIPR